MDLGSSNPVELTLDLEPDGPCASWGGPEEAEPERPPAPEAPQRPRPAQVAEVFAHYRTYHDRSFPKPSAGSKEARLIRARMDEGYSVEDLKQAIDGYHRSPHHLGDNDRGTKYLSLELFMRDGSHVAAGIQYASARASPVLTPRTRATVEAGESWEQETRQGGKHERRGPNALPPRDHHSRRRLPAAG